MAYVDYVELAVEEHASADDVIGAVAPILTAGERGPLVMWLHTAQIGQVWVKGASVMVTKALPLTNSGRLRESLED